MEDEKIVGYVTAFLKKKGFTQTEKIFQEEFQHNKSNTSNSLLEPDIANHLLAFSQYFSTFSPLLTCHFFTTLINPIMLLCRLETGPARFHDGYSRLRTWTYSSLDLYKVTSNSFC